MKLAFDVESKPKTGQLIIFAFQQMLAVLAATIAVPMIVGNGLTPAAAMTAIIAKLPATVFNAVVALIFAPILGVAIRKALERNHLSL